jgi:acyl-CoA synthetase (AMP-forming)/AMP-acid ligase II
MSVGAASVPSALMERAEKHGCPGTRTYGSTEHPTISGALPSDPFEKRATTDGRLLAGVQVRLIDDEGRTVGTDIPGEIVSMGPELFKGYLDPTHNEAAFADDGWFHTGDIGQLDADGYLRIVDRKKDIIIRGGENISSKEVEDTLVLHPMIAEAAVVAWPDRRMGERVGAFVRLKDPITLTIDDIAAHFLAAGIARQKTPERLVVVVDFPRTPAGKILKTELREHVRSLAAQEKDPA